MDVPSAAFRPSQSVACIPLPASSSIPQGYFFWRKSVLLYATVPRIVACHLTTCRIDSRLRVTGRPSWRGAEPGVIADMGPRGLHSSDHRPSLDVSCRWGSIEALTRPHHDSVGRQAMHRIGVFDTDKYHHHTCHESTGCAVLPSSHLHHLRTDSVDLRRKIPGGSKRSLPNLVCARFHFLPASAILACPVLINAPCLRPTIGVKKRYPEWAASSHRLRNVRVSTTKRVHANATSPTKQ